MNILYLDLSAGISGDMFLGVLLDLGVGLDDLRSDLARLGVGDWELSARDGRKGAIGGTRAVVTTGETHVERHLEEVVGIIRSSSLDDAVKERAIQVFERLARAEGRVHRIPPESVHFHEVGALDAIVDVVGTVAGLARLGVDRLLVSPVPLGRGTVTCAHGTLPLPAPAALELLAGFPVRQVPVEAELTTPTGAALVTTLGTPSELVPAMVVRRVGYGLGSRDLPIPNVARGILGTAADHEADRVVQLEANIDDTTPEILGHAVGRLLAAGALDAWITPVQMKKGRPGVTLAALCLPGQQDALAAVLFAETTTLGVRFGTLERRVLQRRVVEVQTRFGAIRVKLAGDTAAPEYEDCAAAADRHGVPLRAVYDEVRARAPRGA